MADMDDYRGLRRFLRKLLRAAGDGPAANDVSEAICELDRIEERRARSFERASEEREKARRERDDRMQLERAVASMRADMLELEERARGARDAERSARNALEKAKADSYEEGFAAGFRFGRRAAGPRDRGE